MDDLTKEIREDINKRISAQPDSRCASPDEVRICWLLCEIDKLQKIVDEQKNIIAATRAVEKRKLFSTVSPSKTEPAQTTE